MIAPKGQPLASSPDPVQGSDPGECASDGTREVGTAMMQFRVVIVVLMFALSGCAALGPPVLKGHSGPNAWEVADVVQGSQERGTQLRWDYSVVLHNTSSRGIYLERLGISAAGAALNW